MPNNTVYVGRPTKYGNPFEVGFHNYGRIDKWWTAQEVCVLFEQELDVMLANLRMTRQEFLKPLRGKNLACFCPLNQPCHADILLRLANEGEA